MEMSTRVEYALIALLKMASCHAQKTPLKLSQITLEQAIPDRYLEQILMSLRHGGIVQSQRGARGGYALAREPRLITLLDVVASIEGNPGQDQVRKRKSTGHTATVLSLEKRLVDEIWQQAREASQLVLNRHTLQDLCQHLEDAKQVSPMYHI